MNSDNWPKVKDIFDRALARPANERAAFVRDACAGDEEVRQEVESLLQSYQDAGSFMDMPAAQSAARSLVAGSKLAAGQHIKHYVIAGLIGQGGMGEVYLAQDTKLGRKVALKILSTEFARHQDRMRRFTQEAKAASALNHPNILTIYEIDESESVSFIATEFIDGETLREHALTTSWRFGEVLDVAAQIAGALTAAHAAGIVHRDIKPDNVMLRRDGIVKILDFGIAKLAPTHAPGPHPGMDPALHTEPGKIMGTVAYMSPEQIRGLDVDARTDIWSLGVLIYEMVAGCAPFTGETASHVGVSILEKEPAPLASFTAGVPAELERIVRKSLAKARDERYQTARDLLIDLKSLRRELDLQGELQRSSPPPTSPLMSATVEPPSAPSIGAASQPGAHSTAGGTSLVGKIQQHKVAAIVMVGILAALIIGGIVALNTYLRSTPPAVIDSVAVLPFVNASSDPNTEYLSDGLTEDFINSLSRVSDLRVIARTTVFRFKGRDFDPQGVGRELGVGAVVTGKVTQQGDTLSVQVDLIRVADGTQLWGQKYTRRMAEVLKIQDEIVQEVTARLRPGLSGEDKRRVARKYTDNTEAYQAYSKGRYYARKFTAEDTRKAIAYFNQATDIDPNYAPAYVGQADAYWYSNDLQLAANEAMPKAKAAALKALSIDESLAEAHSSLGIVLTAYDWDWAAAEKEFRRAIELKPEEAVAYELFGWYLSLVGRFDEAQKTFEQGQRRDPLSLNIAAFKGISFYRERKFDLAIEHLQKTLEIDPNFWLARVYLGWAYTARGQYNEAIAAFEQARAIEKNHYVFGSLGHAYALAGRKEEARRAIVQLTAMSKDEYVSPYSIAIIYAGLGENDAAFEWLNKAYDARSETMGWIKVDARLDKLRSDARFAELVRRVGLS